MLRSWSDRTSPPTRPATFLLWPCSDQASRPNADEKRKAEEQLGAKLVEDLTGTETALERADWTAIRKEALAKVEARKLAR